MKEGSMLRQLEKALLAKRLEIALTTTQGVYALRRIDARDLVLCVGDFTACANAAIAHVEAS